MASANGGNTALMNRMAGDNAPAKKRDVKAMLADVNIKKRFEDVLGKNAPAFMSSIISVTNGSKELGAISQKNPMSIIAAGSIAAALNLPIDPNLGFAYIIPYGDKATFQMGYKGFIQLAMRTGQYKTINASEVYEGEIEHINRFTGDITFGEKKSDTIIGYIAYFRLTNGFEKYLYMTTEEIDKHAKTFSQTYKKGFGRWKEDFHAMAIKTVLKRILSKYGILSIEMQGGLETALAADQAVVVQDETGSNTYEYPDTIDVESEVVTETATEESDQTPKSEEGSHGKRAGETDLEYHRRITKNL